MRRGFTLAELLIALAILGVIATFTIPKVLQAQQDGKYNSIAKEAAGAMSEALMLYRLSNEVNANTRASHLLPYLNYVKRVTTHEIDYLPGIGTNWDCPNENCYLMHNGAVISLSGLSFGGTATTNAIYFLLDPDGKVTDGTTNGPGKSIQMFLYTNGRLASYGTADATTTTSGGLEGNCPTCDPSWFSWD